MISRRSCSRVRERSASPNTWLQPPQSSSAVSAHAILGEGALATCGGPSRSLACVLADPPSVVALPLEGAEELTGVGLVCPLSNARLLVGTDTGSLVCLSKDAPPVTLISGFAPGSLKGACLSSDEKKALSMRWPSGRVLCA